MNLLTQEELLFHQVEQEEKNKFHFHIINISINKTTTLQEFIQGFIERTMISKLIMNLELTHITTIILKELQEILGNTITTINLQELQELLVNITTINQLDTIPSTLHSLFIPNRCIQCIETKPFILNQKTLNQYTIMSLVMNQLTQITNLFNPDVKVIDLFIEGL